MALPWKSRYRWRRWLAAIFCWYGRAIGFMAISDPLKPSSKAAVAALRAWGLRVLMLTGDHERTAAVIARQAGVDDYVAGVLPDGKADAIKKEQTKGHLRGISCY